MLVTFETSQFSIPCKAAPTSLAASGHLAEVLALDANPTGGPMFSNRELISKTFDVFQLSSCWSKDDAPLNIFQNEVTRLTFQLSIG